jgi:hypothetical protein
MSLISGGRQTVAVPASSLSLLGRHQPNMMQQNAATMSKTPIETIAGMKYLS